MTSRLTLGPAAWRALGLAVTLSAAIPVAIPTPACAQDPLFWPHPLDTIQVVRPRPFPEEAVGPSRGFVQVVPLGSSVPPAADLGELLDRVAGVHVRRTGGWGATTLASVRGSSPSQVQILLNDTPLSSAPDAVANLALIPLSQFSRLEILRGPQAIGRGSGAAGILRLVTPDEGAMQPRLRLGAGSFGTTSVSGLAGLGRGSLSLLLAGGRTASRGDFPYLDRGGTPWEPADDRTVRRRNNAFHQEDLLIQIRRRFAAGIRVETIAHGLWKDAGIPGTESLQTRRVHDRFRRWLQSLAVHAGSSRGRLDLAGHVQIDRDRFRNPDAEVGLGASDQDNRTRTLGGQLRIGLDRLAQRLSVEAAAEIARERWEPEDRLRPGPEEARARTTGSAGSELRYEPLPFPLTLFAGAQGVAAHASFGAGDDRALLPRAGFVWEPRDRISIRGSWGRSARFPSLLELFGRGGVQVGNPDLEAERGAGWDLGGSLGWGSRERFRAFLQVAYFESETREAILWLQNSQRSMRATNVERTEVRGVEGLLRALLIGPEILGAKDPRLAATATVTFQDARDRGPTSVYHGAKLPYLPDRQGSLELRAEASSLSLAYIAEIESGFYRDRYNTPSKRQGGRVLQDLEIARSWLGGAVRTSLSVRNLADVRTHDVDGFPLPGRSFQAELTLTPSGPASPPARAGDEEP